MREPSRNGSRKEAEKMKRLDDDRATRTARIIVVLMLTAAFFIILIEGCWTANMLAIFISDAEADTITEEVWVLCKPEGTVNLRATPGGRVFGGCQSGAKMWTDNRTKNGFLHVMELAAEEENGWISARYIVYDEPREVMDSMMICSDGRVACREWIGGRVIRWVQDGELVTVYWISDEWAVTEFGYIRAVYLGEI